MRLANMNTATNMPQVRYSGESESALLHGIARKKPGGKIRYTKISAIRADSRIKPPHQEGRKDR
jgi:hypothetical protein